MKVTRKWNVIILPLMRYSGMAIFPFIFLKDKELCDDKQMINHEKIHHRQQIELLLLPFYILYALNYLCNLIIYKSHHLAYVNICFEREAYANDRDLKYLENRRLFKWMAYIKIKQR